MKSWKSRMTQVQNLRKRSASLVYDRVVLLVDVYRDEEFLTDEGLDELSAANRLDDELADVCAGFLELKAVLEFYPDRKQWEGRRLDLIVAEVLEAERKQHKTTREPRKITRVTKAKFEDLTRERNTLTTQLSDVRDENISLHEEIGQLKHRISELESLLSEEAAMV